MGGGEVKRNHNDLRTQEEKLDELVEALVETMRTSRMTYQLSPLQQAQLRLVIRQWIKRRGAQGFEEHT
jgi:hypothetical protein